MPLLDIAKGIACSLIVGHHLTRYGVMPDGAFALAPGLVGWLAQDGRLAVQVFLVIAGFLAASSLAPDGVLRADRSPAARILQRYARLTMPYLAALSVCVIVAALVRPALGSDDVPATPTMGQLLAHGLLVQDLLDYDALSTGVWYVAIDFQLFVLALALMSVPGLWRSASGERGETATASERRASVMLVVALVMASLALFNRRASFDTTALYFFGAYGLGMLVFWAGRARRARTWRAAIGLLALTGAGALMIDWRSRIALALFTALMIAVAQRRQWLSLPGRPDFALPLQRLGRISYSLFLIHFPVLLATNAVVAALGPHAPWLDAFGMVAAFGFSIAAAQLLYRQVEARPPSLRAVAALFATLLVSGFVASV